MPGDSDVLLELSHLRDAEAIRTLKANYGRVVDGVVSGRESVSVAEFAEIFLDEAGVDFPGALGSHRGLAAIKQLFGVVLRETRSGMWHAFHSPIISIDGDVATGQWTVMAVVKSRDQRDDRPTSVFGRYLDDYVRTAAGWRIKHLLFERY